MQPSAVRVVKVRDIERTREFYEALGYVLCREQHEDGPVHYSADFGRFVQEFYPAAADEATGPANGEFWIIAVEDFERVLLAAGRLGLKREKMRTHSAGRLVRSAVFEDPDGYRILVQEIRPVSQPPSRH